MSQPGTCRQMASRCKLTSGRAWRCQAMLPLLLLVGMSSLGVQAQFNVNPDIEDVLFYSPPNTPIQPRECSRSLHVCETAVAAAAVPYAFTLMPITSAKGHGRPTQSKCQSSPFSCLQPRVHHPSNVSCLHASIDNPVGCWMLGTPPEQ